MKRFTLILASLFLSLGAVNAQEVYVTNLNDLSNEKTYLIESARCVLINSANVTTGLATTNGTAVGTVARSIDDQNQQFKIEKDGDSYYLYSVGAGKYVTDGGAWADTKGTALTITDISSSNAGYPWKLSLGSNYLNSQDPNQTSQGIMVNGWSTTDPGNSYRIIDIEETKALQIVEITYNFVHEGKTVHKETVNGVIGQAYPDYSAMPWGVSAAAKPSANVTAAGTVNIEVTFTPLPFEYADSYTNIEHWYYVNVRDDDPTYMQYDSSKEYIPATASSKPEEDIDSYTWAFVGNPFGFQIVNLAAGETMVLSAPSAPTANQNAEQLPRMVAKASATGNTTWTIVAPTHNDLIAANGFYIQHPTAPAYAINRQNYNGAKTLCYWNNRDTGSTFQVVERPMGAVAELEDFVSQVNEVKANYLGAVGTAAGNLTEASVNNVAAALTAAEELLAGAPTAEQATEAQNNLKAAIAALATVQPTEGKFYTIASASADDTRNGDMIYIKADGNMAFANANATSLGNVFQFEDAGEGKKYLRNVVTGTYLNSSTPHQHGHITSKAFDAANAVAVTVTNMGKENIVKIVPTNGGMVHAEAATGYIKAWDNEAYDNGSAWRLIEIDPETTLFDLAIGATGYSTLYLGCAVTVPAGVKAFPVTVNGEWAVFGEALTTIPANTGVIIAGENGEAAAADTYKFSYAAPVDAIENNQLKGSTINTYVEGAAYVLANDENGVGFYKTTLNKNAEGGEGDTHFLNNANKAYLEVPAAEGVACYSFRFGEGTTGIENVKGENGNAKAIFDLTGRKVNSISAPGIYIVNGKKVLVK